MSGLELIAEECERVRTVEGHDTFHDDRHTKGELAQAAAAYALTPFLREEIPVREGGLGEGWESCSVSSAEAYVPLHWPWSPFDWKPSHDRKRELVKAGQLIVAELDRLERLAQRRA